MFIKFPAVSHKVDAMQLRLSADVSLAPISHDDEGETVEAPSPVGLPQSAAPTPHCSQNTSE